MLFLGLDIIRGGSAKNNKLPNPLTSLPRPTTLISSALGRTKTLAHRHSAGDLAPPRKSSGLDKALELIHPRTSELSNAKLKIAPSGAIVFTSVPSQESLGSTILSGKDTFIVTPIQ